ncbi:hypothetical protein A8C56_17950 [Niabella ginsenosidivorans]|uniref:Plasmid pRiA4b Orf3-like domain-containing protein n=1 Tax=Niabella ginsenosidivorans TaxID=1176587 RepID=A0A1A9I4J6_9BACT|nr:hypothetical protein [Niabella ginsenosidivorans]ANH82607.1 hypothetical protein A8C56_17950 [Niabella ginsenosidivorans]
MAILKFRVYFEEDDSIYRDIVVKHTQTFFQLHEAILGAFEFDNKHQATFFRSNDHWQKGREISLEAYKDRSYKVAPLLMRDTTIGSEIKNTNQRFTYTYDFQKHWDFLIELINVSKDADAVAEYPKITRVEGISPKQYGTKGLLGEKFADIEEKYDLSKSAEGFGEKGADGEDVGYEDNGDEYTSDELDV